jgi:hypothetical protein
MGEMGGGEGVKHHHRGRICIERLYEEMEGSSFVIFIPYQIGLVWCKHKLQSGIENPKLAANICQTNKACSPPGITTKRCLQSQSTCFVGFNINLM